MKRIFTILCALALILVGSATALAANDTGQSASYYPISVEEYTYGDFDELRINKVYQLSLSDDPSLIPTEDGYVGVLRLDHTSVQVTTDGYATKTSTLSATRSYPNLSDVKHS